ncbi:MAG: leucine-rich repeat protein [Candidatus Cryptobacteroides sp.]
MKYNLLMPLACIALLAGCTVEPAIVEEPEGLIPINVDGAIKQVQTKVSDAGFVDKDALGLFAVNYSDNNTVPGTLLAEGNQADNVKYVFDEAAHKWNPVRSVYYKDVNTNVDLYVYYPYSKNLSEVVAAPFEVQKDQSTAATASALAGYEASDFLWGKQEAVEPSESAIRVSLSHKMSSVQVKLVEKDGFAEGEFDALSKNVIVTNTTRKATIDYSTGAVTALGNPQADGIVMCPQTDGSFRAIVVPQTVAAGLRLFSITIDGITYGFKQSAADVVYEAGKQMVFSISISKKTLTGEYELELADCQIINWTEDLNTHAGEARQYYVVNVETPGTLGKLIKGAKKNPDKIRNLKVTGQITDTDFYFMRDSMAILEAVNLKEVKVTKVGSSLMNDIIPSNAFNGKTSLVYFSFPERVTLIGDYAFNGTNLSGALIIPDDVVLIGKYAFASTIIGSVVFNAKLERVLDNAFYSCRSLSGELHLPESITYIGNSCFFNCILSGKLNLPDKLEYLGRSAFYSAGSFVGDLKIPEKLNTIYSGTFEQSTFTGSLLLNNVTNFEERAFSYSSFSGELVIPEGTIEIPKWCFSSSRFTSVVLPSTLRRIEQYAFYSNPTGRLMGRIDFPEGLVSIEDHAFYGHSSLLALSFPSTCQTIGKSAFEYCSHISNISCSAIEPPTVQSGAFDGVAKDNFTVEVPAQSVKRYQAESGWSDFKRIAAHYDFSVSRERMRALNAEQSRTYILRAPANFEWTVDSKPDWVSVSPESGTGKTDITITVSEMPRTSEKFEVNEGTYNSPTYKQYAGRAGEVVFKLTAKDYTTSFTVEQYDSDYADGQVISIQSASIGSGIDIVYIGDGYDAKDIAKGTFLTNVQTGNTSFFDLEPYNTYSDYFNVYAVVSQSDDSGIGTVNTIIDTKFGSSFSQNRILPPSADDCFAWAKKANASLDLTKSLTILLMNTSTYEGVTLMYGDGSALACCPVSTNAYPYDFRGIVQHEAGGHGFGKLGDEYIYHNAFIQTCNCNCCEHPSGDDDTKTTYGRMKSKGWFKNLSMTSDNTVVPWAHLIYNPKYSDYVDMYEGGYMHTRGVYRSEATSCMNNNIPYYSAISRQAIVERIKYCAGESFSLEEFYAKDSDAFGSTKAAPVVFDRTFGVDHLWNMGSENGSVIYMGERPNLK